MNDPPTNSTPDPSRWLDPATLMRIKGLQLRAKVVVDGFLNGLHRSPFHGFSVEFSEYRQYTPGDDPRYLDWRLFARTDRYYIKRFEDETNLRCHLLVDFSRSMDYGSLSYSKSTYARTLAATLAYFLMLQRDAVGLLAFHQKVVDYIPARFRPGHLHRLFVSLENSAGGTSTDLARPLEQIAELVTKRGLIVLISDLLSPPDALHEHLGGLRSRGHEVMVMRVLDPAERTFNFRDASHFQDAESGRRIYVDPDQIRTEYLRKFQQHAAEVEDFCRELGVDYVEIGTDQSLELVLFDFLQTRQRGKQTLSRRPSIRASL